MHLLLIRHGETDWNSEWRIQGHTDTPLNTRGIEQAERLAARLAAEEKIDVLYSSPLARARVTAEKISAKFNIEPILDDRLKEKALGEFEGLALDEIELRYPEFYKAWRESKDHFPLPGEESSQSLYQRVQAFLADLRARHTNDARITVVSHGATLSMFVATLAGIDIDRRSPFWFDNASVTHIDLSGARPRIRLLNDTCHLRDGHANQEWRIAKKS